MPSGRGGGGGDNEEKKGGGERENLAAYVQDVPPGLLAVELADRVRDAAAGQDTQQEDRHRPVRPPFKCIRSGLVCR